MSTDKVVEKHYNSRKWNACWIWKSGAVAEQNSYCHFRKKFLVEDVGPEYKLYITAETYYKVHINGKMVGRGPVMSQPYYKYYDVYSLENYLQEGINCISVTGCYTGITGTDRAGLLAEIQRSDGQTVVSSDRSWKFKAADAWMSDTYVAKSDKATPFQEIYDARKEPLGWQDKNFDDSGWGYAKELINDWKFPFRFCGNPTSYPSCVTPWTFLLERDIPFMREKDIFAESIYSVEECLHLENRAQPNNVSLMLSIPGRPVKFTKVVDAENLLSNQGATGIANGKDDKKGYIDGIYDPCIILDFGKVITARIELDVLCKKAGCSVDIGYAERLVDGYFINHISCPFTDRFVMREGRQKYSPYSWEAFRYVKLRFYDSKDMMSVYSVKAVETSYPFSERGMFESGDDLINGVYDICKYTLKLCCNESIMDTPWREKGQWLGDVSAVTLGGIYACFGDTGMPAKFLSQSAENQFGPGLITMITNRSYEAEKSFAALPDYSLWWIWALWNHYMYTGQEHWIHTYYPHVIKILQTFLKHTDDEGFLVNLPGWTFIDWVKLDKREQSSTMNAIFYYVLECIGKMAELKNDEYYEKTVSHLRASIKKGFMDRYYNSGLGCFADARYEGKLSESVSEHANCMAILAGLCDAGTANGIISKLYEEKTLPYTEAQPFFASIVLKALAASGRIDLALEIIRIRWGMRMVEDGATSTYEEWSKNGSERYGEYTGFMRSLSHAWSAFPAEFLIRGLMGLVIQQPGCGKISLNPFWGDFDYKAVFPVPQGEIEVECKGGQIRYSLPDGVECNNPA